MLDLIKALPPKLPDDSFKIPYFVTSQEADVLFSNAKGFSLAFESGTAHGFSSCVLASAGTIVHTFDIADRKKVWTSKAGKDLVSLSKHIHCHIQPFADGIVPLLKSLANTRENAIFFIDGDHKIQSVVADWNAIKPFLKPGDRVLFHDLNMTGPRKFWGRLSTKNTEGFEFEVKRTERIIGITNITKGYNHEKVQL